jgi:hypothetical protein
MQVMNALWSLGMAGALGALGCASTGAVDARGEADFSGHTRRPVASVRIGDAHVIGTRINPLGPVSLESADGELAVSFTGPGRSRAVARLDAASLQPLALSRRDSREAAAPRTGAARVVLDGGRFIVCWTRGSLESGNRALAQAFNQDGSPRGAPVVISPPEADVVGTPRAVATGGGHVVATFAASAGGSFELVAVPLETVSSLEAAELTARR